jgi:AraC-like DNA-binding protein
MLCPKTAAFGLPPVRYLRELRLRRASELLATSDAGVEEIGYQSGFSRASYFCRVVREGTGLTPSEFRRSRS